MVSCKEKDQIIIQKNDRLIKLGNIGTILVTDKCVVIMRDSINYNANSGVNHHSLATRVYTLPVSPTINKVTLLNNDTVRSLSKEQIEEIQKRIKSTGKIP